MYKSFLGNLKAIFRSDPPEGIKATDILDAYVLKEPTDQNVLDIFEGQWSSQLPDKYGLVTRPGLARLFEDDRVVWTEQTLGKFSDWKILELGPLEGGHSYMFQNKGAKKIISIEANSRAFLKCLCIKEILELDKVEFKLGDFVAYLENDDSKYDLVFASGVLYHMEEPIQLLKLISEVSDRLFIWTHYYDQEVISNRENLRQKFSPLSSFDYDGVSYEYSTQAYQDSLEWTGFCGGSKPTSKWLTRDSIMRALEQYGFNDIQINFDHRDHQNGPAFALCARR